MISLERLTKRYGEQIAVDALSLEVKKGEVVGFLGPNGAGKTTTLRMLTGYLAPTSGKVRIGAHELEEEPEKAKALIGYMPENAPLYGDMRVGEYLLFRARLKGIEKKVRAAAIDRALLDTDIRSAKDTTIAHLSKGYRQRVALADAVLGRPPVLILDEPTASLDPNQIEGVRRLIRSLQADHAIVVSTHVLAEVEALASRVVVLHRGQVVTDASVGEATRGPSLTIRGATDLGESELRETLAAFASLEGTSLSIQKGSFEATFTSADADATDALAEALTRECHERGIRLHEVTRNRTRSLETLFRTLTTEAKETSSGTRDSS